MKRLIILAAFAAVVLTPARAQTTLLVPSQYPTIQAGIVAAQNADTVLVASGNYVESINFLGKAITVRSARGPDATIIDANHLARVVSFENGEGPNSIIEGFTITNGLASGTAGYDSWGGGIRCWYASPTIRHCHIVNNQAGPGWAPGGHTGGGIMTFAGAPMIDSCLIANNSAGVAGGGVHFREQPSPTLTNCVITGNTALGSGGVDVWAQATPLILNCTIVGNASTTDGGGVTSGGGPGSGAMPTMVNTIVWGNVPTQIYLNTAGQIGVSFSDIQGGYPGVGNLSADPLFAAGPLPWHIRASSPCLNAGTTSVPFVPLTDFEGDPRVVGVNVDIGADEFGSTSGACAIATNPLLIGASASIAVLSSPNAPIYVLLDIAAGSVPLGVWGHTQIALSPAVVPLAAPYPTFGSSLTVPYTDAVGSWSITAAVPNDPQLVGMAFYAEGYVLDFSAPNGFFRQTNLLTIVPR